MNTILKLFLTMSCSGTLLILILFFGKRFLKDRLSRQWQYYIWLLVIIRLLFPFGTKINLMEKTYLAIDQTITNEIPSPQQQSPNTIQNNAPALGSVQETYAQTTTLTAAQIFKVTASLLTDHLWLIWLAAALGMLIRKITVYESFVRYISSGLTPVSDMYILDQLSIITDQIGIKKPVELCISTQISSPMLMGYFHPYIILPSVNISEKNFRYIMLHELIHYKRKDMIYKWLVQITVCLHWFNPFVHLMSREITKACEFSCDEAVLIKTGYTNAEDYGKTLLDAMAAAGKYKKSLGVVNLSDNKQILKERLMSIMKYKRKSMFIRIFTCMLTLCMIIGSSFLGIYPVSASLKKNVNHKAEYKRFDITIKGSAYYYDGNRIRIFHDMKADRSFENSFVDMKGTVDVRLIRGKRGNIKTLELIPKAEADEILEDLFGYAPSHELSLMQKKTDKKTKKNREYTDIKRLELDDIPDNVQTIIKKQCTDKIWYVIQTNNNKYVYYNNLPRDYAFSISGNNLNVRDMGRHTGIYVLLSLGNDLSFKLSYNANPIVFTTIDAD